jgi:hypothetical protein
MANLICKQCSHENESERVYCHNCGAKLDRSLLPDESSKPDEQKAQQRRVKKLTSPSRGFFAGWIGSLVTTLLWGALLASAYQMSRPPDDVPPMPKKGELADSPQINLAIENALALHTPQRLTLDATAINTYIQNAIRSKETGPLADYVKFDRAFVNLEEGVFRMTAQQSALEYPFYASIDYSLAIEGNKVAAKILGGKVGRMPIHPMIMAYADVVFQKLWDALRREHRLVDGMGSIEVHKDQFVMVTKAAAAPAR